MDDIKVKGHRVLNRVYFSPDPNNPSIGTEPVIVETRRIADLTTEHLPKDKDRPLPTGIQYIFFEQVVEISFEKPVDAGKYGSNRESMSTTSLERETYHVAWSSEDAQRLRANNWQEIPIHPSLMGFMWVFGGSVEVAAQKKRSSGKTVVLEGGRHLESWGKPPGVGGMRMGTPGGSSI